LSAAPIPSRLNGIVLSVNLGVCVCITLPHIAVTIFVLNACCTTTDDSIEPCPIKCPLESYDVLVPAR
jgi:hypothetical protein